MIPVLNRRSFGNTLPEGFAYVGRPSIYGNPFSHLPRTRAKFRVKTRDEAIQAYDAWLQKQLSINPKFLDGLRDAVALVCWCAPLACHGDILAEELDS